MVLKVRVICWHFTFILFSSDAFEGYIPIDMYLLDAEPTPELRDHILAYDPAKIENLYFSSSDDYLRGVQKLVRLPD